MRTRFQVVAALALPVILATSLPSATSAGCPSEKDASPVCPAADEARTARQGDGSLSAQWMVANLLGMELVYIAPGEFFMGSADREEIATKYGAWQGHRRGLATGGSLNSGGVGDGVVMGHPRSGG